VSATTAWLLVGLSAVATAAIKAAGPLALGGRDLPGWATAIIAAMPAALLAALVVTSALADGTRLHVGADTAGVAVAGLALWRGASVVAGVLIAAGVTAVLRAVA
jgi:branched-subunit amino acid transport protein